MMLAKSFGFRRSISTLPYLCQKIEQTGMVKAGVIDGVQSLPKEVEGKGSGTEIRIAIKSFEQPLGLPPFTRKIALPESRSLYTVNRSPHVDKKSREQFHMKVKKQLLIIKAERHELSKKYFWLKRQRILGAQYEIQFFCKTRLDKEKLQRLLGNS